jgi:hypothetical protein
MSSSITLKSLRIAQNKLRNTENKWGKESRKEKVEKIKCSRITSGCRRIEKNLSSLAIQQTKPQWSNPKSEKRKIEECHDSIPAYAKRPSITKQSP